MAGLDNNISIVVSGEKRQRENEEDIDIGDIPPPQPSSLLLTSTAATTSAAAAAAVATIDDSVIPTKRPKKEGRSYEEDRVNFLDLNDDVLKNIPKVDVTYLSAGRYFVVGIIEKSTSPGDDDEEKEKLDCIYLLQQHTNHVECVLGNYDYDLNEAIGGGSYVKMVRETNFLPEIIIYNPIVSKCSYMIKSGHVKHLEHTKYKNYREWKIQSNYPFAGARLVKKQEDILEDEKNEKENNNLSHLFRAWKIETFPQKMRLFRDGVCAAYVNFETIITTKNCDNYQVYVIAPIVSNDGAKQYIMVIHDVVFIYDCENDGERGLLDILDEKPNTQSACLDEKSKLNFNEILYGDYVIELNWNGKTKSFNRDNACILKLAHTKFYDKKLVCNVFRPIPK